MVLLFRLGLVLLLTVSTTYLYALSQGRYSSINQDESEMSVVRSDVPEVAYRGKVDRKSVV